LDLATAFPCEAQKVAVKPRLFVFLSFCYIKLIIVYVHKNAQNHYSMLAFGCVVSRSSSQASFALFALSFAQGLFVARFDFGGFVFLVVVDFKRQRISAKN